MFSRGLRLGHRLAGGLEAGFGLVQGFLGAVAGVCRDDAVGEQGPHAFPVAAGHSHFPFFFSFCRFGLFQGRFRFGNLRLDLVLF
ncbi:MAG: hypothetical protein KatS3mg131_0813 [Candidatus Tectimicrobiota bacterium]|nr:MAG: hypothetical protein KatS3mg131_0813 [Candidatus Tectomicrobia bacterium]